MTTAERDGIAGAVDLPALAALGRRLPTLARSLPQTAGSVRPGRGWALACSGLAPALLTVAWLIGDALEPASYSPLRQTVSVLAGYAGTDRWIVTGALYAIGICYLVTAAGMRAVGRSARIGLTVAGIAAFDIALSPQPVDGGTVQHAVWTVVGAIAIAVWPALVARRDVPPPHIVSVRTSTVATAVSLALLGWTAIETQGGAILGLAERLSASVQICWPFVVAVALRLRRPAS